MENVCHGENMFVVTLLLILVLLGPLAYSAGVDSRSGDARGGWPGRPRH